MYKYLLIPGRHQAITKFQINHLKDLLNRQDVERSADIVWAITSANHGGTRRNPISGSRRLGMVEAVVAKENLPSQTYRITNHHQTDNFAHYVIEDIRTQSRGAVDMNPKNTLLVCSTKDVAQQYIDMGYKVDTAESSEDFRVKNETLPWDVVEEIISSGAEWRSNAIVKDDLHPGCLEHYLRYGLGDLIVEVFQDPLINSQDGDLTETRDYDKYRQAFEDGARRKLDEFKYFIKPGRILDVGCATGETIKIMAEKPELFESDFYGVEAARHLYSICQQRKDRGDFGDANVFFYQRNIMRSSLFPRNYLDTVITMALTHEIESYLGRDDLYKFLHRMYEILSPGGVYINYDVLGPKDKDKIVYVLFNDQDGMNPDELYPDISGKELTEFLESLSSKSRFLRFAKDFRAEEGDIMEYKTETIGIKEYFVMRNADLCDFLAKKDYLESWHSEMHERFCFWEYDDWKKAVTDVGFEVIDGSEAKQNPWLIENRFAPAAEVYEKIDGTLRLVEQPVTNILLVAKK